MAVVMSRTSIHFEWALIITETFSPLWVLRSQSATATKVTWARPRGAVVKVGIVTGLVDTLCIVEPYFQCLGQYRDTTPGTMQEPRDTPGWPHAAPGSTLDRPASGTNTLPFHTSRRRVQKGLNSGSTRLDHPVRMLCRICASSGLRLV